MGERCYSGVAHSYLNRHRILLERVQTADRRSDACGPGHCGMGILACHLLSWHVGRLPWTLRRKGHQEIGFDLDGLLRLWVRRYRSQYCGGMAPRRVHLLWRDHGYRVGRRLSDAGEEPDAVVRRQQRSRHRHRRRGIRSGQGHRKPGHAVAGLHDWSGAHVLCSCRRIRGNDADRLRTNQASSRIRVFRTGSHPPSRHHEKTGVLGDLAGLLPQHHLRPGIDLPREGHPA